MRSKLHGWDYVSLFQKEIVRGQMKRMYELVMEYVVAGRGAKVKYSILKVTKVIQNPKQTTGTRHKRTVFKFGEINRA